MWPYAYCNDEQSIRQASVLFMLTIRSSYRKNWQVFHLSLKICCSVIYVALLKRPFACFAFLVAVWNCLDTILSTIKLRWTSESFCASEFPPQRKLRFRTQNVRRGPVSRASGVRHPVDEPSALGRGKPGRAVNPSDVDPASFPERLIIPAFSLDSNEAKHRHGHIHLEHRPCFRNRPVFPSADFSSVYSIAYSPWTSSRISGRRRDCPMGCLRMCVSCDIVGVSNV